MSVPVRFLITVVAGAVLWFLPIPQGVTPQAWHLFAIMVATILGFILAPLPIGAMAFLGMTVAIFTKTLSMGVALSGFANGTIWMILAAFLFSRAFVKTGLGRRIALNVLSSIGDSTLKVSYALAISGLIVAPATPSATARAGGIIFPILRGICTALDSEPDRNPNRVGRFLVQTYYQTEPILSAMFLTAMAANPLCATLAMQTAGVEITWMGWMIGAIVPGIASLLIIPAYMYFIGCPPEIKHSPEAKALSQKQLAELGPMNQSEKYLAIIFVVALLLWCLDDMYVNISPALKFMRLGATLIALMAVCAMLVLGVLTWDECLAERGGWDTFVWMGVLVMMAGQLSKMGFISWFAKIISGAVSGMSWLVVLGILYLMFMYSQYAFASLTAHVAGLYAAFLAVAVGAGAPPMMSALLFAYTGCLCYSLTQYSSGPGPIFYGAGYFPIGAWWRIGFQTSIVHVLIWGTVGPLWWKILGHW